MVTRIVFFLYGCFAYLLFLATFLYAIAFVGGFAVPTKLDGAPAADFGTALLVDTALLAVFALQHSVMARPGFKRWWTQMVPWAIERSTYVLAASLALDLLFWQWRPLGGIVWTIDSPALRGVVWTVFAFGWLQVLAMTLYINHLDLFGVRQVWLHLVGRHYTRVSFVTPAPYRVIRHPLYLGFILAFWAAPTMTVAHLLFAAATTIYILIAIQFEERDLADEHGAPYTAYRSQVPMLVPSLSRSAARARAGTVALALSLLPFADASPRAQEAPAAGQRNLVNVVRDVTARFRDVRVAEAEGYALAFGCVSGGEYGAMGLHYVNFPLVLDGALDAARPEIVIYEPLPNGDLRLVGADYLVLASDWHAAHPSPPELMGQLLHLFESPNRFGLPNFYTLHVWAWKENPTGTFANWHANVSCDAFGGG